jgi:gas vesicle protein
MNQNGNSESLQNEQNSMLLKGVVIGGLIGGALALIDRNTRSKVKNTAVGLKDSSSKMLTEVKENPGELKDQMISQFKSASHTLKEAIEEAQDLYQRVNKTFGSMAVIKEVSNEALSTFKEAKGEINNISSKVKEAGEELTGNPFNQNSSEQNGYDLNQYSNDSSGVGEKKTVSAASGSSSQNRSSL